MVVKLDPRSKLLTPKEAAEILCVHENTLRRWTDLGIIPAFRLGSRGDRRYLEADVRNHFESGAAGRKPRADK